MALTLELGTRTTVFVAILVLGIWTAQAECRRSRQEENDQWITVNGRTYRRSLQEEHEQWMTVNGRTYENEAEKEKRSNIYSDNAAYVDKFNSQGNTSTFKLKTNPYSDLTKEEFLNAHTGGAYVKPNRTGSVFESSLYDDLSNVPSSIDWRKEGAVTPVKVQGLCGSCWAFSAVQAIEGLTKIQTGELISLSAQQLVDCTTQSSYTRGCIHGNPNDAFDYIIQNGGITTESNYPYQARSGACDGDRVSQKAAQISGYEYVPENNEKALLKAVSQHPVTAFINASGKEFRLYASGVFNGECSTTLDHVVLIVGYGTAEDGSDYWLIKNSWGTDWGEDGYVRLLRNSDNPEGHCGIAIAASYPTA